VRISGLIALAAFAVGPSVGAAQPETLTRAPPVFASPELPIQTRPILVTPSAGPLDLRQYPPDAPLVQIGPYVGLPQQLHTPPQNDPSEQPSIQPMINMYQRDRRYSDMFNVKGGSMICSVASLANAILFLRVNRRPPLTNLAETSMPRDVVKSRANSQEDMVRTVFVRCQATRAGGSTDRQLLACAQDFLAEGGYPRTWASIRSLWAEAGSRERVAPQPADLRQVIRLNRTAVLLFGWYTATQDPVSGRWTYARTGGHFVTLAGYDKANRTRIYVSNPLIDYDALGTGHTSAVVLEPVGPGIVFTPIDDARSDNLNTAAGQKWQTRDMAAHRIAVLESMVEIGPPGPFDAAIVVR